MIIKRRRNLNRTSSLYINPAEISRPRDTTKDLNLKQSLLNMCKFKVLPLYNYTNNLNFI